MYLWACSTCLYNYELRPPKMLNRSEKAMRGEKEKTEQEEQLQEMQE